MGAVLESPGSLLIDAELHDEAREFTEQAHDRRVAGLSLTLDDGTTLDLHPRLAAFVGQILHGVAQGPIRVMTLPDELTSTIAASMLGVSRSTLMKLHNEGEIDSRRVGSHHRFRTDEVLGLLERRRKTQRRAFDALRELDEMLDPHDSPE